jgi:hypothetical protein
LLACAAATGAGLGWGLALDLRPCGWGSAVINKYSALPAAQESGCLRCGRFHVAGFRVLGHRSRSWGSARVHSREVSCRST